MVVVLVEEQEGGRAGGPGRGGAHVQGCGLCLLHSLTCDVSFWHHLLAAAVNTREGTFLSTPNPTAPLSAG